MAVNIEEKPQRLSDVMQMQNAEDEPEVMRLGDLMSTEKIAAPELNEAGFFQVTDEQRKEWEDLGPIGYFEQAIRQDKTEMIPFNPESAVKSVKLLNAVNRVKRDKYEANPGQKDKDTQLINNFLRMSEEERIRGYTIGGRITQGVGALPGFMIEFLATGGAAAIGKRGVKKAVSGATKKIVKSKVLKFATRTAGGLAGATVRTAAMPHRVVESYADRQINASLELTEEGLKIAQESREKPFISFSKAFGDVVIENFSEVTGPELGKIGAKIIPKRMAGAMIKLWKKLHPNEAVNKLFIKAGYHGFLEELGEERVGALLRAVFNVEDFGAKDADRMWDRIIASIPNGEELLVEAAVLAFPGVTQAGTHQALQIIRNRRKEAGEVVKELDLPEEIPDEQIDGILAEGVKEVAPEEAKAVIPVVPLKPEIGPEITIEEAEKSSIAEEKQLLEDVKELEERGVYGKLPRFTKKESTILKEKIQNVERGIREGTIKTKKEIKTIQTELINMVEKAGLEAVDRAKFIRTIKNVQTQVQLEKALPEIRERVRKLAERGEKEALVREINRFARVKVDADYREQMDEMLEQFDLKRRTEATKKRRQKKAEFIDRQREEGNLDFLPPDFFTDFGKKTLDEMSLSEVDQLRDQIRVLATVGATKAKLLAIRGEKDFQSRLTNIIKTVYDRIGKTEQVEGEVRPLVSRAERGMIKEIKDQIDSYFAIHRKIEFVCLALQINNDIFETMQEGINKELTTGEEVYEKLKDAFALISKDLNSMIKDEVEIDGISLTRQQMIGVALNNGNPGNRQRLIDGNKFTIEQVRAIEKELKPNERQFVERVFEIIDSLFPKTVQVTKKLYGIKPRGIEGKYFPIVADKELSKEAKLREAQRDLFQDVFHVTFVERGFTKERTGGRAPINLNAFDVIFKHIDSVIHYNSLAIPVRDIQKIITNPRFRKSITEAMDENVYNQFPSWLRDISNPRGLQASNTMDKISQFLRHNATAAILGHRLTVSLLQGGSFTQTINEIGLPNSIHGITQFYKNPKGAIEFVYSKSPIMKNRKHRFDREIRDWLKTKEAVKITQGKKSYTEMLFELIRGVDFITTMPSWIGAYEKNLRETQNPEGAARYADGVVRRTQPAAAMENLSAVMRGSQTQKLFTSFMTHFSNMHNQLVLAMDNLKYSKNHPLRKSANFARSMWWVWIAPSLLAGWVRSGFKLDDWRRYAQELVLYPFTGMFLIRDLMGAIVKGFDFGAPPGLSAFKELSYAFKGKRGRTKIKHGAKAIGLLTGKIPTQWVDTIEGFIDLINEETQDFRRLIWSEAATKPVTKGILTKPKDKPTRPKIGD